jgi:hypothetical protein
VIENQPELEVIPPIEEDVETHLAEIHGALEGIPRGFLTKVLEALIEDMNSEYIEPEDPYLFGWIDDLLEDER